MEGTVITPGCSIPYRQILAARQGYIREFVWDKGRNTEHFFLHKKCREVSAPGILKLILSIRVHMHWTWSGEFGLGEFSFVCLSVCPFAETGIFAKQGACTGMLAFPLILGNDLMLCIWRFCAFDISSKVQRSQDADPKGNKFFKCWEGVWRSLQLACKCLWTRKQRLF